MKKLIFIILFLWGCSPTKLLQMAIEKGAKVKTDTVFQNVVTERTVTDTVTRFQTVNKLLSGDTVVINTVRWRLKERIDTITKTRYVQVECKPDTLRIPVAVTTEISAGYTAWQMIGSTLGGILFVGLIAFGTYKMAKLVKGRA
jgi:threonine synthase